MNNIQYIHVELVVFFSCSNCNKLLLNETVVKLMTWAKFQLLRFFFFYTSKGINFKGWFSLAHKHKHRQNMQMLLMLMNQWKQALMALHAQNKILIEQKSEHLCACRKSWTELNSADTNCPYIFTILFYVHISDEIACLLTHIK